MATVPLIVLLYDRVFEFDSLGQAIQARWRLYAALAATWLELVAFMSGHPRSTVGASSGVDVWNYLLNQFVMVVQYLRLTLWPRALAELGAGVAAGTLKYRETVANGLDSAPGAFLGLLAGKNFGKQLVKL